MCFNRDLADLEFPCDILIREPRAEQLQDASLSRSELLFRVPARLSRPGLSASQCDRRYGRKIASSVKNRMHCVYQDLTRRGLWDVTCRAFDHCLTHDRRIIITRYDYYGHLRRCCSYRAKTGKPLGAGQAQVENDQVEALTRMN